MTAHELLNEFGRYIKYNPNQTRFNLFSSEFLFHNTGKTITSLLSKYDPTGVLAVIYAKKAFQTAAGQHQINLKDYLLNPSIREDMEAEQAMYEKFQDPEILQEEKAFLDDLNRLITNTMGIPFLGERDEETERMIFEQSVIKVAEELDKCRLDIYRKAGPIGKIEKFTTKIMIFEQMSDCLLSLEQAPDALYICYINQHGSMDGYFSYFIKNNGNLLSICNRVPEAYIGQHSNMRNGNWSDRRAIEIFPYDSIFNYSDYDYKGYATKYQIDTEKLDFMNLSPDVYTPLLIAMILLRNCYEGKTVEGEELYLNTLLPKNLIGKTKEELMVIKGSSLLPRHEAFSLELDQEKILDGSYNERFHMENGSQLWVDLYGKGFQPDFSEALSVKGNLIETKKNGEEVTTPVIYTEFVATKEEVEREIYRVVRKQLADYIRAGMEKEYERFGGREAIFSYWREHAKAKKESFIEAICQYEYEKAHPQEETQPLPEKDSVTESFSTNTNIKITPIQARIRKSSEKPSGHCMNDKPLYNGISIVNAYDDQTGKKSSIFYRLSFENWLQMEAYLGESLPKIFKGYIIDKTLSYNGNSILYATDAVGDIYSLLYGAEFINGKYSKCYSSCDFNIWIGFSKIGWKRVYEEWLKKNQLEDEITRLKEEEKMRKEAEQEKANLPAAPYKPSELIKQYDNKERLIQIERELDAVFPGERISSLSIVKNCAVFAYATLKEKGHTEQIQNLEALGWRKQKRAIGQDRMYYVRMEKYIKED